MDTESPDTLRLRLTLRDGSTEYVSHREYLSRLRMEYDLAWDIKSLDQIRVDFNHKVNKDKSYDGFLLSGKGLNGGRPRTTIAQIQSQPFIVAALEAVDLRNRLGRLSEEDGALSEPASLVALGDACYKVAYRIMRPLYECIRHSYDTFSRRMREEMADMTGAFNAYEDGASDWLEFLSMSDNMNDSQMEKLLKDVASDLLGFLDRIASTPLDPGSDSYLAINEAMSDMISRMLHARYELNRILAAANSPLKHFGVFAWELAGSTLGSMLGPMGGIPTGIYFGGGAKAWHQLIEAESYEELGLDYEVSPYQKGEVIQSGILGGIFGALGPVVSVVKKIPGVQNVIGKGLTMAMSRIAKHIPGTGGLVNTGLKKAYSILGKKLGQIKGFENLTEEEMDMAFRSIMRTEATEAAARKASQKVVVTPGMGAETNAALNSILDSSGQAVNREASTGLQEAAVRDVVIDQTGSHSVSRDAAREGLDLHFTDRELDKAFQGLFQSKDEQAIGRELDAAIHEVVKPEHVISTPLGKQFQSRTAGPIFSEKSGMPSGNSFMPAQSPSGITNPYFREYLSPEIAKGGFSYPMKIGFSTASKTWSRYLMPALGRGAGKGSPESSATQDGTMEKHPDQEEP